MLLKCNSCMHLQTVKYSRVTSSFFSFLLSITQTDTPALGKKLAMHCRSPIKNSTQYNPLAPKSHICYYCAHRKRRIFATCKNGVTCCNYNNINLTEHRLARIILNESFLFTRSFALG